MGLRRNFLPCILTLAIFSRAPRQFSAI